MYVVSVEQCAMSRTIKISDEELKCIGLLIDIANEGKELTAKEALSYIDTSRTVFRKLSTRCENEDDFANIRKEFEDETR